MANDKNVTVSFRLAGESQRLVDARQRGGSLVPVFPSLMGDRSKAAREEAYIARMIARDRESGLV